jgi:hypothetical protein
VEDNLQSSAFLFLKDCLQELENRSLQDQVQFNLQSSAFLFLKDCLQELENRGLQDQVLFNLQSSAFLFLKDWRTTVSRIRDRIKYDLQGSVSIPFP